MPAFSTESETTRTSSPTLNQVDALDRSLIVRTDLAVVVVLALAPDAAMADLPARPKSPPAWHFPGRVRPTKDDAGVQDIDGRVSHPQHTSTMRHRRTSDAFRRRQPGRYSFNMTYY